MLEKLSQTDESLTQFETTGSWIPLELLVPNPLNPRPWSDEYQARVYPEKVKELERRISLEGFDLRQALIVRPITENGVQKFRIVVGHHRWAGGRAAGMTSIPCFVDHEMTDEEEAISVIDNQGREVELWCEAEHAYQCCYVGYGDGKVMTQESYAALRDKKARTIGYWIIAYRVKLAVGHIDGDLAVRAARDIFALNEEDWVWFTKLCLDRDWEGKARKDAIQAVKAIEIPPEFQEWLDPQIWKREAAIEAAETPAPQTVANISRWVSTAQKELKALPDDRPVWNLIDGVPHLEKLNLQQKFLQELPKLVNPNETKIKNLANQVLESLKPLDAAYKQWQEEQRNTESRRLAEEAAAQERLAMEIQFAPKGYEFNIPDFIDTTEIPEQSMDAVFLQSLPRLNEFSERDLTDLVHAAYYLLKEQGVFICTCSPSDAFVLYGALVDSHFDVLLEPLAWTRRDPKPQPRLQSSYQMILVAKRGKELPYFNFDGLRDRFPRHEITDLIDFIGDHGLLAEFLLTAYVPPGGHILEAFAKSVPVTCAAKRLGYKATWVQANSATFTHAEAQIEQTPYHWEIL